ncbi:hypothetical protein CR513_43598, partial [Mucuna pruriens]
MEVEAVSSSPRDDNPYVPLRKGRFPLDLGIAIPFDDYEADLLQILGVMPSQLHPNGWAAMQAFRVLCHSLRMHPRASLFLAHYSTHISAKVGWVSLSSLPKVNLFNAYSTSYKDFKNHYVKICAFGGASFVMDEKSMPLYWQESQKL